MKKKTTRKVKLGPKVKLEWKEAKRDETLTAHRQTWESECGSYQVVESISKFSGLGTTYYAIHYTGKWWAIIGEHRKYKPAEKTCETHARSL